MSKWKTNLEVYDKLVALCSRFDRKGKTMPYTSANGYMFSLLNKDGDLGIRFDKTRQTALIEELDSSLYLSYGAVMKGYVLIPEKILNDSHALVNLLNESFEYVMTLEPK